MRSWTRAGGCDRGEALFVGFGRLPAKRAAVVIACLVIALIAVGGCRDVESTRDITKEIRDAAIDLDIERFWIVPSSGETRMFDVLQKPNGELVESCTSLGQGGRSCVLVPDPEKANGTFLGTVGLVGLKDYISVASSGDRRASVYLVVVSIGARFQYALAWVDAVSGRIYLREIVADKIVERVAEYRCGPTQRPSEESCLRNVRRFLWRHFDVDFRRNKLVLNSFGGLCAMLNFMKVHDTPTETPWVAPGNNLPSELTAAVR